MSERVLPHNIEAERSVIGAAMLSTDALFDIMEHVKAKDFFDEANREIFEAITALFKENKPVDSLTVFDELKRRNTLEMVGGRAYVASLAGVVPATANAGEYAKIVEEKATLRNLIMKSTEIIEKGYEERAHSSEVLEFAERGIFEIGQERQRKDFLHLQDILFDNVKAIEARAELQGKLTGITTGFSDLDYKTSGLQKSDLIILAARPSMGKTAFALNVARHAAVKGGGNVLIFSMEMASEQLGQRLLSMESRVEIQRLKTGEMGQGDWEQVGDALDTFTNTGIFIDDTPGISVMEMKNKCRRMKAEKGLDLVVIDYLQLMSFEGRTESRTQEISALSRYLKLLAREMDCPVIVLSQLSRAPEQRSDHRPMLSDLRESGSIEQDADIVLFLYRDEYYFPDETEKPGVCEVIIAKHRNGPTGVVELTWLGKYTRFVDKAV